jgi:RimJ/RimL family protein N-acetyltransferase
VTVEGLTVRAFRPGDAAAFARFEADPVSCAMAYGRVILPGTAEATRRRIEALAETGRMFHWIWADPSGEAVGFSLLHAIDRVNHTLWTGSAIFDPALRGRGLGSLGRRLALDHVFNEMGFRRVYGEFAVFNEASRRSHDKVGAELVGRRRRAFFISGRHHDSVVYMVRRERFNELFPPDPGRHLAR